jgi:dihydrofolate reductase
LKKNNQESLSVIGHAIVSSNFRIADSQGNMPEELKSEVDWKMFQSDLDKSDLVILGRKSFEKYQSSKRFRLVATASLSGLLKQEDIIFFNPNDISIKQILNTLDIFPKKIAIAGGRLVYELVFKDLFYTEFHLSIKTNFIMPNGVPVLNRVENITQFIQRMRENNMFQSQELVLDKDTTQLRFVRV